MRYPTLETEKKQRFNRSRILSSDTSAGEDLFYFIEKMPSNLWWLFYNPTRVNVDDLGRLTEKAVRKFYQPTLTTLSFASWANPRKKNGVRSLRAMDLDSYKYIEPVLYHADKIVLEQLEPIFDPSDRNSAYYKTQDLSKAFKVLAYQIEKDGGHEDNSERFNDLAKRIHAQKLTLRNQLEELSLQADQAMAQIDEIDVPAGGKSLKRERVKSLRQHIQRIQKQGVDLYRSLENAQTELIKAGNRKGSGKYKLSETLKTIGNNLRIESNDHKDVAIDLIDSAYTRQMRKTRIRDNGLVIEERDAAIEDYRKTQLGIQMNFVPDKLSTFPIVESPTLDHNAENYFILTVEYGMNNAFKDGKYVDYGQRGPKYGLDMAEHITKLFTLGKAEDALYAIQLLKMAEGPKSYQMFPNGFQEVVKEEMAKFYGVSKDDVQKDEYAGLFLERIRDISGNRNHSPLIYGPRDTEARYIERMKDYIYGRAYPGAGQFLAVPLTQKMIQHPAIKARSKLWAHLTGGHVVPMSEFNRPAKETSVLEKEIGLGVKYNWWFKPKQEKSEENPKPPGLLSRSPFWLRAPINTAMVASVPAALVVGTGGVAAPLVVAVPIVGVGVIAGAKYGWVAAKNIWALPMVHKPVIFTAKWTAIGAATAGTVYVAAPLAPAVMAWGMGLAIANPLTASAIAAPIAGVAAISTRRLIKDINVPQEEPISFGDYREQVQMEEDPLNLHDDSGAFLASALEPEPEAVDISHIDETPDTSSHDTDGEGLYTTNRLVKEFMDVMQKQNESFIEAMNNLGDTMESAQDEARKHHDRMEDIFTEMAGKFEDGFDNPSAGAESTEPPPEPDM